MLLSRGALVEHADAEGDTPLIWAAWQGHPTCVEFLLAEAKAKIDHQDEVSSYAWDRALQFIHSSC